MSDDLSDHGKVTVQLVFSDSGAPRFRESFYEFYAIALLPYVIDIPVDCVTLVLRNKLAQFTDSTIDEEHLAIAVDGTPLFSDEYKQYFKEVYRTRNVRSIDVDDESDLALPECTIRVISGQGHGNFGGGNITIGRKIVRWPTLGALPTCRTVLDISSAAYALAHFEGKAPPEKKWHRFDEIGLFNLDDLTVHVPVVCDRSPSTYAFRVGYEGQRSSGDPEKGTNRMARAVGDSAVASLLCAMKEFSDDGGARSLDESFASYFSHISPAILPYEMLEARVLEADIPPVKPLVPCSRLNVLEDLLKTGIVSIDVRKFDCPFFALRYEWFLSTERVGVLSAGDNEAADEIVSFVVEEIQKAYHGKKEIEYHFSQVHWNSSLVRRMGPTLNFHLFFHGRRDRRIGSINARTAN